MFYWLYKQIQTIRKAIAGRDHPEQLAWAVALGCWIGLVPKGNLVAVCLIALVLTLRVNHAMAAVTAVAVSFSAFLLDGFTGSLGQWVLENPLLRDAFVWMWQQPLVPWTDLNNTIVMGSLVFGLITLFPTYSITLPIFKSMAPKPKDPSPRDPQPMAVDVRQAVVPEQLSAPLIVSDDTPVFEPVGAADSMPACGETDVDNGAENAEATESIEGTGREDASGEDAEQPDEAPRPHIDVIRIRRPVHIAAGTNQAEDETKADDPQQQTDQGDTQEKAA